MTTIAYINVTYENVINIAYITITNKDVITYSRQFII